MLADQLIRHSETYGLPLPQIEGKAESSNEPKVILDPHQSEQMVLKLFELKISMLCDPFEQCATARFIVGQRRKWCIRPARHYSAACRDLDVLSKGTGI